jgi:hypothetical protein
LIFGTNFDIKILKTRKLWGKGTIESRRIDTHKTKKRTVRVEERFKIRIGLIVPVSSIERKCQIKMDGRRKRATVPLGKVEVDGAGMDREVISCADGSSIIAVTSCWKN